MGSRCGTVGRDSEGQGGIREAVKRGVAQGIGGPLDGVLCNSEDFKMLDGGLCGPGKKETRSWPGPMKVAISCHLPGNSKEGGSIPLESQVRS